MTGDIEQMLPGFGSGVRGDSTTLMGQARWEQGVHTHTLTLTLTLTLNPNPQPNPNQARWEQCVAAHRAWEQADLAASPEA